MLEIKVESATPRAEVSFTSVSHVNLAPSHSGLTPWNWLRAKLHKKAAKLGRRLAPLREAALARLTSLFQWALSPGEFVALREFVMERAISKHH